MQGLDLRSILTTATPRERDGSEAVGRFGYQVNVGIQRLLDLYESGEDFWLIFDYFDDLAVLDSEVNPTKIRLYQVKSKDPGVWTVSDLCKKVGKKPPRSYVSRLYHHVTTFGNLVAETGFITNAAFKIQLRAGGTTTGVHHEVVGTDIHDDEIAKIAKAINQDIKPADVPAWLPKFILVRTTFGVHGQEDAMKGRLVSFFDKNEVEGEINITAAYKTLYAYIQHCTGFNQDGATRDEIIKRKSISRAEFDELIKRASTPRRSLLADWSIIQTELEKAGWGTLEIIRLKSAAIKYQQDRQLGLSPTKRLREHIVAISSRKKDEVSACKTILDLVDLLRSELPSDITKSFRDLTAALIVEAYRICNEEQEFGGSSACVEKSPGGEK